MPTEVVRKTKHAVTVFPYFEENGTRIYLFLKRNPDKAIDPNMLNGIGGKVEAQALCENILQAAIRELEEETGIVGEEKNLKYFGLIHFLGGYNDDWITHFLTLKVAKELKEQIATGTVVVDGTLFWLRSDEILSRNDLVPDLYEIWNHVNQPGEIFAATMHMTDGGARIEKMTLNTIPR